MAVPFRVALSPSRHLFSCLLLALLLSLAHLTQSTPMCIRVKTLPMQDGSHWDTKHNSMVLERLNKRTSVEWEIWANIDGSENINSFWTWSDNTGAGNNTVRANGAYIHQMFTGQSKELSFRLETEEEDAEAITSLSVIMASYGINERSFLSLTLNMVKTLEADQEPPTWPVAGEQMGHWNLASLRIEIVENLPSTGQYRKFMGASRNIAVDNCL